MMANNSTCPEVFNCLTGIGVCVIKREIYDLLYCNDKYREIKDRLWRDVMPQDTFRTTGGRRMLEDADRDGSCATVFHDAYSGEDLDITINKTDWEGTASYIMTFAEHRMLDEEDVMVWDRQLLGALMRVYPMIMSVNLTRDTYAIMEYKNYLSQRSRHSGIYSELHLQGLASTHPDYQEAFAAKFSRDNLLARYAAGKEEAYLEALQMGPDRKYHWSSTHAIRVRNPYSDDVIQFILVRPLDDQQELEREIGLIRAEANRYRGAITRTFSHIYEVNVADDVVYEIKFINGLVDKELLGSVQEVNRSLILARMHPSHLESYGGERPWMKFMSRDGKAAFTKGIYEDDWYLRQSSGQYRWERIQIIPGEDDPDTLMIFSKDIHEVKLREEQQRELLLEALANAEQANAAKRDFLSHMSHDMRTPMNAIVGLTTIAQAKIDDKQKVSDALVKIQSSSQHLLRLINDVLDMSRIESGKITLEEEKFNVSELMESVMASIRTQAKEKEQTLVVHTQDLMQPWLVGDRVRLEQVLINLLSNSVKYTGRGGMIMLSMCDTPGVHENMTNLTICVEDNGVGMSEEFVGKLFDPFEREIQPETAHEQGTGLGLPIVKNIIDRMNGTIRVDSALGMGTCFAVNVPMKIPEDAQPGGIQPDAVLEMGGDESVVAEKYAGRRFLLVDDNELNREIGQEILQMFGAKVDLACDGQQAIDILIDAPAGQYDAVFMDVQMPVKNGHDATREIRAGIRADLQQLPIFAMTANAFADDVQDALDAGMNAHIPKPLDLATLNRVLDRYLL